VDLDDERPRLEGHVCGAESHFDRALLRALDLERRAGGVISIIGAGGKTTLMFALAHALAGKGRRVVTSTTTKILPPGPAECPCFVAPADAFDLERLNYLLSLHYHITIGGSLSEGKVQAPEMSFLAEIREITDWLILEADGAAGKPIKAPEPWEPVVPDFTDVLFVVVGLDALNRRSTRDVVFRLERFLDIAGLREGDPITSSAIVKLLLSPSFVNVRPGAAMVAVFNKTDVVKDSDISLIKDELNRLSAGRYQRIVCASLKNGTVDFFKPG
jgi:probable selenium-dependent hydroxylase accessory protein YqeC